LKEIEEFKSLSPARRNAMLSMFAASLALVAAAERDVHRRASADVRGPKIVWQILCLNALGALSYFRWGRRKRSEPSD
jgi:hypothetical protein